MNAPIAPADRKLEGRHVLWIFAGFFGLVFAVNGYFAFAAISTYSGVVAQEPYRKGLAYNDRIAADELQNRRGWHDKLTVASSGDVDFTLIDPRTLSARSVDVTLTVARPSTQGFDRTATLIAANNGNYAAKLGPLPPGTWIATIEARDPATNEPVFRSRRRLWLKP